MIWVENENEAVTEQLIQEQEITLGVILPKAYKQLLRKQNGGLIRKNHFPTTEPTSYGLDYGEIYYLASSNELLTDIPEQKEVDLAGKQVFFHRDESRYIGFSYTDDKLEPSIIYVDFETLQTLIVAENMAAFLAALYFSPFPIDFAEQFPTSKLEQILTASNIQKTKHLLELLEDYPNKKWYLETLIGLLEKQEIPYNLVVYRLFKNQLLYFRRKLAPDLVEKIFSLLNNSAGINKEASTNLYKEWQ